MRTSRTILDRAGITKRLETSSRRSALHVRSMLSIYDAKDMASLDVPWWTYRAAERVEEFLASRSGAARVFEWGSGASTLWLGQRSAEVISVEHDTEFVAVVRGLTADMGHVTVRAVPAVATVSPAVASGRRGSEGLDFSHYVASINEVEGQFDLIVIDGRARSACLAATRNRLAPDGMIVFDNSNRGRYRTAIDAWAGRVDFLVGFAPALPYRSSTALLTA